MKSAGCTRTAQATEVNGPESLRTVETNGSHAGPIVCSSPNAMINVTDTAKDLSSAAQHALALLTPRSGTNPLGFSRLERRSQLQHHFRHNCPLVRSLPCVNGRRRMPAECPSRTSPSVSGGGVHSTPRPRQSVPTVRGNGRLACGIAQGATMHITCRPDYYSSNTPRWTRCADSMGSGSSHFSEPGSWVMQGRTALSTCW